jgi:transposase
VLKDELTYKAEWNRRRLPVIDRDFPRLVYDKKAHRYTWHLVIENGKEPKPAPGNNVVAVDLGEIHPAVIGDAFEATLISCRERRSQSQGHAQRLAQVQRARSRKTSGSRRFKRLIRAQARIKGKHQRTMRDIEHKISRAIVSVVTDRKAGTIALGDVRDVEVTRYWLRALRRRGQHHRLPWKRFRRHVDRWIPHPQILHPYPDVRFDAKHPK